MEKIKVVNKNDIDFIEEHGVGWLLSYKDELYVAPGDTFNGYCFKSCENFYNNKNGLVYIPESSFGYLDNEYVIDYIELGEYFYKIEVLDNIYNYYDFNDEIIELASDEFDIAFNGDDLEALISYIFDMVDWQSPGTLYHETDLENFIHIEYDLQSEIDDEYRKLEKESV